MNNKKVNKGFSNIPLGEKIAFLQSVLQSIADTPALAAAIDTTLLQARLEATIVAEAERDAAKAIAISKTSILKERNALLNEEAKKVAGEVERFANGNETLIEQSGFNSYTPGRGPAKGTLQQVQQVVAIPGTEDGTIALSWKPVEGTKAYIVHITTTPDDLSSYRTVAAETASKIVLENLQKGTQYWIRVSALGAAGEGPKSDPAESVAR